MSKKQKFEKTMRSLMKEIDDKTFDLQSKSDYELECLYECLQRGYIRGIHLDRCITGQLIGRPDENVRVLYPGYVFMDTKFPNLRSNIAIAVSVSAFLISILCEFTPIPEMIKQLFC